ncbi:MAG: ABC transporter substrate-binding protein [Alphaproteobacteria bacterium]|nr:ABC transporter substrate-binding protein [Alphaproteobacteria bacterium]
MNRLTSFVTAAAAAVLVAVAPGTGALAQTKVGFAGSVTWFGQVPIMVAIEKGFFKEQGIEVNYQVILNSSDRIAALTAGSVQFSNLGRLAVIAQMAAGNQSFYYLTNIDDSPGNEGCIGKPGINSFKDLKGKKVAANTSAEITMHGLLRANNMVIGDITYLNLPPNEMAGALSKGDVDAACVWQPLLDGVKKAVPEGKLLGLDTDTDTYQKYKSMGAPDIVIISKKWADENQATAKKLVVAMLKGADYTNSNPDDTAKAVAHYFKRTPEETLAGIKAFQYFGTKDLMGHAGRHEKQMQDLADWLYDNKKLPTKVTDVTKWRNTSLLQ